MRDNPNSLVWRQYQHPSRHSHRGTSLHKTRTPPSIPRHRGRDRNSTFVSPVTSHCLTAASWPKNRVSMPWHPRAFLTGRAMASKGCCCSLWLLASVSASDPHLKHKPSVRKIERVSSPLVLRSICSGNQKVRIAAIPSAKKKP